MSTFKVEVVAATIQEHPNADALELCRVGGYLSIVRKGQYQTGDLVAYIPEQAVLPEGLIEELGLTGKLAGSKHDRVKAMRLRGILSQGLVYPARSEWVLGQDVTEELEITKYEPVVPTQMAGLVMGAPCGTVVGYDIENWKNFPDLFQDGEPVVFTEKLHGTWTMFSFACQKGDPNPVLVSSKGLAGRGLVFQDVPENENNLYLRMAKSLNVDHQTIFNLYRGMNITRLIVLGETFGQGVQDLGYGVKTQFRVFDIGLIRDHDANAIHWLSDRALDTTTSILGLERVPVLYRGPFSLETMEEHTTGKETVSGKGTHIREGIVMRPQVEREVYDLPGNRLQLKSVSGDYLTRKGNVTEYQ